MTKFFSPAPLGGDTSLGIIRIVVGLLMVYHGKEVFQPELMKSYMEWDQFKTADGAFRVYAGKSAELVAGISLCLGLYTRLGGLLLAGTLGFITFFVGNGRFWYEDQHPFLFALFGILFVFMGPGRFSLDAIIQKPRS
jgi:putative oxidoreductase